MNFLINPQSIMREFAAATGLSETSNRPRRYLWTDAFAVSNYLELYHQSDEQGYLQLALKLVEQVHQTLGKQRKDSGQSGWLSGLNEEQGKRHPTQGGLRIGKKLRERLPGEPIDESLEWDRDGQYYHYLTKWMQALNDVSRVTGKGIYNQWALELARVTHAAFVYTPATTSDSSSIDNTKRMYWKMSVDLSRPLVCSMGHHDPLDGLITYRQLQATAQEFSETSIVSETSTAQKTSTESSLKLEIEDMLSICEGQQWETGDALGSGGLLTDAFRLGQLVDLYHLPVSDRLAPLLHDIESSLNTFVAHNQLDLPAEYRLAFRELGLAIGLPAINKMQKIIEQHSGKFNNADQLNSTLAKLTQFCQIAEFINQFWLEPENRAVNSWLDHADINNVMLAASLLSGEKRF